MFGWRRLEIINDIQSTRIPLPWELVQKGKIARKTVKTKGKAIERK